MAEWDQMAVVDEELSLQLATMSLDKCIRFCPLLHAMADADGKVDEPGMHIVRGMAKLLNVNLEDRGMSSAGRGVLRDIKRMKEPEGNAVALKVFAPTWLLLPVPVIVHCAKRRFCDSSCQAGAQ